MQVPFQIKQEGGSKWGRNSRWVKRFTGPELAAHDVDALRDIHTLHFAPPHFSSRKREKKKKFLWWKVRWSLFLRVTIAERYLVVDEEAPWALNCSANACAHTRADNEALVPKEDLVDRWSGRVFVSMGFQATVGRESFVYTGFYATVGWRGRLVVGRMKYLQKVAFAEECCTPIDARRWLTWVGGTYTRTGYQSANDVQAWEPVSELTGYHLCEPLLTPGMAIEGINLPRAHGRLLDEDITW